MSNTVDQSNQASEALCHLVSRMYAGSPRPYELHQTNVALSDRSTTMSVTRDPKKLILTILRLAVLQLGSPILQCNHGNDRLVEVGPIEVQAKTGDLWLR